MLSKINVIIEQAGQKQIQNIYIAEWETNISVTKLENTK